MLNFIVGGKEYNIEYSIEASLYKDFTEKMIDIIDKFSEQKELVDKKKFIETVLDIPSTTITMLYAGLLENYEDITVKEVKGIVKEYLKEPSETQRDFFTLMSMLVDEMASEGFFGLIGLGNVTVQKTKEPKIPQDHKKKETKAKVTEK